MRHSHFTAIKNPFRSASLIPLSAHEEKAAADLDFAIFGAAPAHIDLPPLWTRVALFSDAVCVATAGAAMASLLCKGEPVTVALIRRVGVRPSHRGRGLFRQVMERTLDWCRTDASTLVLLYTENADLYGRFAFRSLAQSAFAGPAPVPNTTTSSDLVPLTADRLLQLLQARCPVSGHGCLVDAPGLPTAQLANSDEWATAYSPRLDVAFVYEIEDETLILADVIAPVLPRLDQIVAVLAPAARTVRVLFTPDKLGWTGLPESDDTGLMALGSIPPALLQPFRIQPTYEF